MAGATFARNIPASPSLHKRTAVIRSVFAEGANWHAILRRNRASDEHASDAHRPVSEMAAHTSVAAQNNRWRERVEGRFCKSAAALREFVKDGPLSRVLRSNLYKATRNPSH